MKRIDPPSGPNRLEQISRRIPRSSLAAALLFAAAGAAFSLDIYGSKDGQLFREISLARPQENIQSTSAYRIVSHAVSEDNVIYIAAHGDFVVPPPPELELDANIDNYVKEIHGEVRLARAA